MSAIYHKRCVFILVFFTLITLHTVADISKDGEPVAGIGFEGYFTGSTPFGGGGAISVRFKAVPIVLTGAGAYLYGNHGTVKGTVDYWFLTEKIADIHSSASFHWFVGIGILTDAVFYSLPVSSGPNDGYRTIAGGGIGMRMPIGCYFYAGQETFEPYIQCCPEFGLRIHPQGFTKRVSALWSFPISLGCRFWF